MKYNRVVTPNDPSSKQLISIHIPSHKREAAKKDLKTICLGVLHMPPMRMP